MASTAPVRSLPRGFWALLAVWTLFSLGNSSDVFLLLRANELGLSETLVILAYAIYNAIYALFSWPLGSLSDRIPRTVVLAGGLGVFALVYLGFGVASSTWIVWPLFALHGLYLAATEGVARACVADHVPTGATGTAYGIFAAATGGALLVASIVAGVLWSQVGPAAPFVLGAVCAGAALPLTLVVSRLRPATLRA